MENKVNSIEKLKTLCSEYIAKFSTKQKFTDAKLSDATTVVRFPNATLQVGDAVTVITEQGELPLPDSQPDTPYVLEDGTEFTIVNGIVSEVLEAESVAEEAPVAPVATEQSASPSVPTRPSPVQAQPKRVIKSNTEEHVFNYEELKKDFSNMIKPIIEKIEALEKENTTINEKVSKQFEVSEELTKTVEFIADQPATDSIEKKKSAVKKHEDMTELEKYREYKKNFKRN